MKSITKKLTSSFIVPSGWTGEMNASGPGTGGSGWGERPASGWESKAPLNGAGGQSGWDDGNNFKGSSNASNTWSNNKDDR